MSTMTTMTIEFARDARGQVLLTAEQATAVARVTLAGPIYSDDPAWAVVDALDDTHTAHGVALARYVLASAAKRKQVAGVVAADGCCEWCGQAPFRGMPQPPVRVHIRLDGATDDDVARLLPTLPGWLAAVRADPLPERFTTDGSRSISVRRRDITMDQYRAEADAWLDQTRTTDPAAVRAAGLAGDA